MKIAVAKGDGIGPEIMDAVLSIFNAGKVPLEYTMVDMGKWVFDKGFSNGMTPEAQQTIEELGILFKGPMETPKGKGVKSVNVTARKTWNTYANKRVFQTLHGVDTVFSRAGIPIDITIVRENIKVASVKDAKILPETLGGDFKIGYARISTDAYPRLAKLADDYAYMSESIPSMERAGGEAAARRARSRFARLTTVFVPSTSPLSDRIRCG